LPNVPIAGTALSASDAVHATKEVRCRPVLATMSSTDTTDSAGRMRELQSIGYETSVTFCCRHYCPQSLRITGAMESTSVSS
jgi:hypothetical protein